MILFYSEVIKIEDLLSNLDNGKRDKIINSALEEFSKNSFEKASTNIIVEKAEISKGSLFHYFGSKKKLYKYLEQFSFKLIAEKIVTELDWNQSDIFLRLKEISMIKLKVLQKYPYLTDFSLKAFEGKTVEEILSISPDFPMELYSKIYTHNIDYSLFKDTIDIKKALDIIRWTIEKYGDEFRRKIIDGDIQFDYKAIETEIYGYTDMLKSCFYREEYL